MSSKKLNGITVDQYPKLSTVPSKAIRQALADLKMIEKSPKYTINMWNYHFPSEGRGKCSVCFAGAVMARSVNNPKLELIPESFPEDISVLLDGLDQFRAGSIESGLECFEKSLPRWCPSEIDIIDYSKDAKLFKKQMLEMANRLEGFGL